MGDITVPDRVLLVCGIIAADEAVVREARTGLIGRFGELDREAGPFPFDFTEYYEKEMGKGLSRWFVSFRDFIDPGRLADIKIFTNELERRFAAANPGGRRRVNLDPGYVDECKLVLASTKSAAHRVCLGQGIYAEVTFLFRKNGMFPLEWTYPDFRTGQYLEFFLASRRRCFEQAKAHAAG